MCWQHDWKHLLRDYRQITQAVISLPIDVAIWEQVVAQRIGGLGHTSEKCFWLQARSQFKRIFKFKISENGTKVCGQFALKEWCAFYWLTFFLNILLKTKQKPHNGLHFRWKRQNEHGFEVSQSCTWIPALPLLSSVNALNWTSLSCSLICKVGLIN